MTRPPVSDPLPYAERLDARPLDAIDLVVIHCTELPDLATAREYGERVLHAGSGTGNSGHFYIDRDGGVQQWVPLDRVAHHVHGHNRNSIGIELVNRGRFPDWLDSRCQSMKEPYPPAQIDALVELLRHLAATLPGLRHVAGHDQLDRGWVNASDDAGVQVRRKQDPGPLFPWDAVLARIGLSPLPEATTSG
ncbi:MAG: N-acetylmuramoyl-L-alanine amidase [Pseudoxanthomonas suwonensis]|nr:N-acetylmuramoyl-L-alanine amidase [Pseudoxanthomonas suwonensis]